MLERLCLYFKYLILLNEKKVDIESVLAKNGAELIALVSGYGKGKYKFKKQ